MKVSIFFYSVLFSCSLFATETSIELTTYYDYQTDNHKKLYIYDLNNNDTSFVLKSLISYSINTEELHQSAPQTFDQLVKFPYNYIAIPSFINKQINSSLADQQTKKKAKNLLFSSFSIACHKNKQQQLTTINNNQLPDLQKQGENNLFWDKRN